MSAALITQLCIIWISPIIYVSRQTSLFFCAATYMLICYIIFSGERIGDIYTYVRQIETETIYQEEYAFALLQLASIKSGVEADTVIRWLQLSVAAAFFLVLGLPSRSGYFVVFPFFQIFVLNSLRQGFAAAAILAGVIFMTKDRPLLAFFFFALAIGFHSSAVVIVLVIFCIYYLRNLIRRATRSTVLFLSIISTGATLTFGYSIPDVLGYENYIRVEDFSAGGRESVLSRIAFFFLYALAPLLLIRSATSLGQKLLTIRACIYIGICCLTAMNLADAATRIAYYFMALDAFLVSLRSESRRELFKNRGVLFIILITASLNPAGAKMIAQYIIS